MTKRRKTDNSISMSMPNGLSYLMPGLRLIIGNILILAIAIGIKAALANPMPDLAALLMIIGAPLCLLIHWVWAGRLFREQSVGGRRLAINLVLAEICPVIGMLISFSFQKTDDGIPFIIGFTLSILFAIGMPIIVLLSFVFREGRYITTKQDKNL